MHLILYSTDFCQLCDAALRLVEEALQGYSYELEVVDISACDELMQRYGHAIPVLRQVQEEPVELLWPFDAEQVRALLACEQR